MDRSPGTILPTLPSGLRARLLCRAMGLIWRTGEIQSGGPFRCYSCNRLLLAHLGGTHYELELKCTKCHTEIRIVCNQPVGDPAKFEESKLQAAAP